LAEGQRFCSICGQRTDTARLTVRDIANDFTHAVFHVDHSVASLFRALLSRPGQVARGYVLGSRKRYFGPFAFLLLVIGITTLVISSLGFQVVSSSNPNDGSVIFLQRHPNLIQLMQVPLLGLVCQLFFIEQRLNFAEHVVLAAYTMAMRAAFFAGVAMPVWFFVRPSSSSMPLTYAYWAIWVAYYGYAASGFYSGSKALAWVKGSAAAAAAQVLSVYLISWTVNLLARP
jgi:hypothetical protein